MIERERLRERLDIIGLDKLAALSTLRKQEVVEEQAGMKNCHSSSCPQSGNCQQQQRGEEGERNRVGMACAVPRVRQRDKVQVASRKWGREKKEMRERSKWLKLQLEKLVLLNFASSTFWHKILESWEKAKLVLNWIRELMGCCGSSDPFFGMKETMREKGPFIHLSPSHLSGGLGCSECQVCVHE